MANKQTYNGKTSLIVKSIVSLLLLVFLCFSINEKLDSRLQKLSIKIKTGSEKTFLIKKAEVKELLENHLAYDIALCNLRKLDLFELEQVLINDDRISKAEIYIDKHNKMHIGIIQNLPIVRIEVTDGTDYYLDHSGGRILKKDENVRVPVVTGAVDKYVENYQTQAENNLNYILSVSQKISDDEFMRALVDQIHISEDDEVILIPKIGRQRIALGPDENLDDKIYKLKTYYQKGIKNIGLERFKELNLRYDGQIVGVRNES